MKDFKPGQRWICDVDLRLGLGTVQSVEDRIVNITFMATGETRFYARQSAPLTRVMFNIGEQSPASKAMLYKSRPYKRTMDC